MQDTNRYVSQVTSRSRADFPQMIIATRKREPCIFASPEWMTLPCINRAKDIKDEIIDLMVQLPGLMSEFDDIKVASGTTLDSSQRRRIFFQRSKLFQTAVDGWLARFTKSARPDLLAETDHGIPETSDINQMLLHIQGSSTGQRFCGFTTSSPLHAMTYRS
jgi:hypothetical protein